MDRNRSVVDGRDIFASELQMLVRNAFEEGWEFGKEDLPDPECASYKERNDAYNRLDKRIEELLISYHDSPTSYVGAQDETSQA